VGVEILACGYQLGAERMHAFGPSRRREIFMFSLCDPVLSSIASLFQAAPYGRDKPQRSAPMPDVLYVAAGLGLIGAMILYAKALARA
jgi:hypothetical protein